MQTRTYEEAYRASIDDPETFWREAAHDIDWFEFPASILDADANGTSRWFRGGKLNTAWLALDRHVQTGRGDNTALIYDSPVTGQILRLDVRGIDRTRGARRRGSRESRRNPG